MAEYKTKLLSEEDFRGFESLYNDFRVKAVSDYGFELEPLEYNDFLDAINKKLVSCLVLYEDNIPSAFLVYTTMISEAVELNIVHSFGKENQLMRTRHLLEEFMKLTKDVRQNKVVCYTMLGEQKNLIGEAARFGFKFVGITVLRFMMNGTNSREILQMNNNVNIPACYNVRSWDDKYFDQAVQIVHEAFETSADALFDPRFKTLNGTFDILNKITKNIYAEFLPKYTSILMCDNYPVGFCFANVTSNIANIPIVAIKKEHQGKGLSRFMLKHTMDGIIEDVANGRSSIVEVNTCTETNNFQALKLYRNLGFKEDYSYPQSYLPIKG